MRVHTTSAYETRVRPCALLRKDKSVFLLLYYSGMSCDGAFNFFEMRFQPTMQQYNKQQTAFIFIHHHHFFLFFFFFSFKKYFRKYLKWTVCCLYEKEKNIRSHGNDSMMGYIRETLLLFFWREPFWPLLGTDLIMHQDTASACSRYIALPLSTFYFLKSFSLEFSKEHHHQNKK